MEFVTPRPALAQTTLSPDAALQELMDGNKRFTAARLTACDHDLAILKEHTIKKHEPFAAVVVRLSSNSSVTAGAFIGTNSHSRFILFFLLTFYMSSRIVPIESR